jgi:hypothetical protein
MFSLRVVDGLPPVSIAGSDALPGAGGGKTIARTFFPFMSAAAWKDTPKSVAARGIIRLGIAGNLPTRLTVGAGIKPGPHSPSLLLSHLKAG